MRLLSGSGFTDINISSMNPLAVSGSPSGSSVCRIKIKHTVHKRFQRFMFFKYMQKYTNL